MPPTSLSAARGAHARLLTQSATVYTEDAVTGRYTVILRRNLPCRLKVPMVRPTNSGERAELLANRDLWWPGDVSLPEQCMFLIDGVYWQMAAGTVVEVGDGVTVAAHKCVAVRQQVASF